VSSERRPERGAGRERQRRALAAACRRHGWSVLESVDEAGLAAGERNPPGLEQALRLLESGEANALVAAKRERLDQALGELAALLASAQQQGWALVALDCAAETTRPAAAASAILLAGFARCERRSISERTKAALAAKRAQGVRLGRPPQMSEYALERIRHERAAGRSLAAIADGLNADRIPTAQDGRRWYPSTVSYTLKRTD
jgi:DNA invertase Pin-like site-specific DNA recombinase